MSAARAGLAAALAAVVAAALLSGCDGTQGANPSPTSSVLPTSMPAVSPIDLPEADDFAAEVLELTNAERREAGVPELVWSQCAADEAGPRAERSLPAPTLTHEPLKVPCADFSYLGENLARGPFTPPEMVDAWMNSAGHRQNIVDANFTELGVGCVAYDAEDPSRTGSTRGEVGGMACSQVFMGYAP